MKDNKLLIRLDDLAVRFEEVTILITDPNVISDQHRFVRLTKDIRQQKTIFDF
ncbi:MAG: hypothetical protein PHG42_06300 [Bacteroides sp.]|nr:hypothetical protein [Bacteroides sp.]